MPSTATSGLARRVCWMTCFCASVVSWPGSQLSPDTSGVHRKIEISILSYQRPFIRSTCWLASSPAPNRDSETHMVMMTARVIVRFWRRPAAVSEKMWRKRINGPYCCSLVPVDAAALVAHDLAVVELDHALAHLVHDRRVVRRHQDRRVGAVDAVEQLHDADARRGVEVSRRLVGDEDHRAVDEGARDRDALLLAAGQLLGQATALAVQADELEHLGHHPLDGRLRLADHLQREGDVLGDGLVRQQPEVLEHGADLAPHRRHLPAVQLAEVATGDEHLAAGGALLAQDQPEERRLAGSGRADEED